jgi:hypothetical protein
LVELCSAYDVLQDLVQRMAGMKVAIGIRWSIMQDKRRRTFSILGLPGIEVIGTSLQIYCAVLRGCPITVVTSANATALPEEWVNLGLLLTGMWTWVTLVSPTMIWVGAPAFLVDILGDVEARNNYEPGTAGQG